MRGKVYSFDFEVLIRRTTRRVSQTPPRRTDMMVVYWEQGLVNLWLYELVCFQISSSLF